MYFGGERCIVQLTRTNSPGWVSAPLMKIEMFLPGANSKFCFEFPGFALSSPVPFFFFNSVIYDVCLSAYVCWTQSDKTGNQNSSLFLLGPSHWQRLPHLRAAKISRRAFPVSLTCATKSIFFSFPQMRTETEWRRGSCSGTFEYVLGEKKKTGDRWGGKSLPGFTWRTFGKAPFLL